MMMMFVYIAGAIAPLVSVAAELPEDAQKEGHSRQR